MGIEVKREERRPSGQNRCSSCHYDAQEMKRQANISVRVGHAVTRGIWLRLCDTCAADLWVELGNQIFENVTIAGGKG